MRFRGIAAFGVPRVGTASPTLDPQATLELDQKRHGHLRPAGRHAGVGLAGVRVAITPAKGNREDGTAGIAAAKAINANIAEQFDQSDVGAR